MCKRDENSLSRERFSRAPVRPLSDISLARRRVEQRDDQNSRASSVEGRHKQRRESLSQFSSFASTLLLVRQSTLMYQSNSMTLL